MKKLHDKVKKLDAWDISLAKLSVFAFAFFLMTVWPAFSNLILAVHWGWYLLAWIILMIRPWKKAWCVKKKK